MTILESPPLPSDPARPSVPGSKYAFVAAAVLLSAAAIWASSAYTRETPEPPGLPTGLSLTPVGIALAEGAPQWQTLKLGKAAAAAPHRTDAIPARVQIDETRASRVGAPLAGRVIGVAVELGQSVRRGQALFSVSSPDIATLRAEREKAALELAAARTNLARVKAIVAARALPAKEEVAADKQRRQAEVGLKLAEAKLSALRISPTGNDEFTVVAPRDGVVVEKNVLPNQEISPDTSAALLVLADLSRVWVVADVFEGDTAGIQEDATATVSVPALAGFAREARIAMVSAVVDSERHSVPVRLTLDNSDRVLKPNMYAEVRFPAAPAVAKAEVPAAALVSDGAHEYVWVEDAPGRFARREVVIGPTRDGRVLVASGLEPGETVVEEGGILLDNQVTLSR